MNSHNVTTLTIDPDELDSVESVIQWEPRNGVADLHSQQATIANVISTRIAGLDTGAHLLRLCGVEFILWIDHEAAYGDDGQPAPGFMVTDLSLSLVTGDNPLIDTEPVGVVSTSPYEWGSDGNYQPLTVATDRIATLLVAHTNRTVA